jgi:hypothetical protein
MTKHFHKKMWKTSAVENIKLELSSKAIEMNRKSLE